MVKHEVTIELPENVWQELEQDKRSEHQQNPADVIADFIRYILTFPLYDKHFHTKQPDPKTNQENGDFIFVKELELHMNGKLLIPEDSRIVLRMQPFTDMTDDQFFEFCRLNRELRIEQTKEGNIIIMPPTGGATSWRNSKLVNRLVNWAEHNNEGIVFDSSGGFILPNGAKRSPDAAWVRRSRLASLSKAQKEKFLPFCPDFVIELRSPSDTIAELQSKMEEYLENGTLLGWLFDPSNKRVYIYRPDNEIECLENPERISGDPVLPGFVLNVQEIWTPDF